MYPYFATAGDIRQNPHAIIMTFIVTALYPASEGTTFGLTYYAQTHMPLVESFWKEHGLLNWKLVKFDEEQKPPFSVANIITFKDAASFAAAASGPGKDKIAADVSNFCNCEPTIIGGELAFSG
ncbi:unnamed protein product [Clonostachys rosea]|uniref:EthD domain-containing protein n=1 Tax=Bionectria ochroleuca TaxID=29856 RepID=A0ABY6TY53_BIOOC|nr:unnamed protein product [Clonostachys rosea]